MLKCAHCGRTLAESEALKHKTENGQEEIICRDCFKKITGIDYDTFSFRRENAKMTLFAVLFCVIATIYAFAERGPLHKTEEHCFQHIDRMVSRASRPAIRDSVQILIQIDSLQELVRR
jgi:DNA-directed RNA polymerase subunit RPC12/RpoP